MPDVSAVVVTYNCGGGIAETLSAILGQVQHIYIVDNGSGRETTQALSQFAASNPSTHLTFNPVNLGIAAAQNQGIARALAAGTEWVLLLDHDSIPEKDMVSRMLEQWQSLGDAGVGIVAPLLAEQSLPYAARYLVPRGKLGFSRQRLTRGENLRDAVMVIASGCLIHAETLRVAGHMREDFFIDNVDHEFCLRARSRGFKILVTGYAVLYHRQGNKTRHNIGGIEVVTSNYAPLRRYYTFRNRMFLLRLHGKRYPFLFAHEIAASLYDAVRIVLIENGKASKTGHAMRGLWHGLTQPLPKP